MNKVGWIFVVALLIAFILHQTFMVWKLSERVENLEYDVKAHQDTIVRIIWRLDEMNEAWK